MPRATLLVNVVPLALIVSFSAALSTSCARSGAPYDSYTDLPERVDGGGVDGAPSFDGGEADGRPTADASAPACDVTKAFGAPVAVSELNTADEDIVSEVSADGLTIYVSSNHNVAAGVHLFFATRTSTLANFGALGAAAATNSTANEEGPRWAADGKTLYFDSTRSGSRSIWSVSVVASTFGTPNKLTELASSGIDAVPVLSPDELTVYFLSTRAPTADGDIYVATRSSKTLPFATVKVLANVNSPTLDAPGHISADGCTLYLSSQRATPGKFDIFVAQRPK